MWSGSDKITKLVFFTVAIVSCVAADFMCTLLHNHLVGLEVVKNINENSLVSLNREMVHTDTKHLENELKASTQNLENGT